MKAFIIRLLLVLGFFVIPSLSYAQGAPASTGMSCYVEKPAKTVPLKDQLFVVWTTTTENNERFKNYLNRRQTTPDGKTYYYRLVSEKENPAVKKFVKAYLASRNISALGPQTRLGKQMNPFVIMTVYDSKPVASLGK